MFEYSSSLKSLNISNFNTKNVKYIEKMFKFRQNIISLNLNNFNTENVIDMSHISFHVNQ